MRKWKNVGLGCGALVLIVLGASWAGLRWVSGSMCGITFVHEVISPDGSQRLVAFERNCGATSPFITHVSLLSRSESLSNDSGNVFVADRDHGAAPSGPGGGPEVRMRWTSPNSAVIEHHRAARVHKSKRVLDGVQFEFPSFQ